MAKTIAKAVPMIVAPDPVVAENQTLLQRIAQLEAKVKQTLGQGAVEGADVTVIAALDAYNAYRLVTEIDPDTRLPTEHARTGTNVIKLVQRIIAEDMRLSALSYLEIEKWCKAITARPLSKKTGKPIKRATVRNCLKCIRQFIKWASRNYGWTKPVEWHDATLVMMRRTTEERREVIVRVAAHYTLDEIGTLWRYALPIERFLILLGLNFGAAQSEVLGLLLEDVAQPETVALRSKTGNIGKWIVWEETRQLAPTQFAHLPRSRQNIANKWKQLLDRVTKAQPGFKKLSFKWLRKTGSSYIRKLAGQETSSLYLSHGESSDSEDTQLAVYAAADWDRLNEALVNFRGLLLPHISADGIATKTYIPISKIDQIKAGWQDGKTAIQIAAELGVRRATVYRWKP
ncbi:MAG: hypothetical protein WCI73_03995 [Phycisphaerae bacterium]